MTDSVHTVKASTMTDSVQTVEACTITDSAQPMEEASPHPQPIHDHTPSLPPLVIMDKFTQTDTPSPPPTKQAATQTGTPLRDYRVELKAEIARSNHREQWHKEAMACLK